MHVSVKIPVTQGMVQEQLQHPIAQHHAIMPCAVNRFVIPHWHTIGPAQRHDPARRQVPLDLWQLETFVPFGVCRKFRRGGAFQA